MVNISLNWSNIEGKLKGFVYKRIKDKALSEDIVHDVFLKAHSKMHQLKEPAKLMSWIFQIARNTINDHYRTIKKTIDPKDLDWESSPSNFNDCVINSINALLPALPDKYRIPFEMTGLHNTSQLDIALKLGLNYTTAKARVQRARRMLKEKIMKITSAKTDGYGNVILCKAVGPCCQ
jgi:RNA polymerase sigma-70 factor (ECF subfamily)